MATVTYTDGGYSLADLSLQRYRSLVSSFGGPAKSCRFMVRIMPRNPNFDGVTAKNMPFIRQDLAYLCEAAEFPGRLFENIDVRYNGPSMKFPFQNRYEDINLTFVCRNKNYEREFFDNWMDLISSPTDYNFRYVDNYACNIDIFQFSEAEVRGTVNGIETHVQYHYKLHRAWPTVVNPQPVTWADSEFLRLGVTFTYERWTRPKLDGVETQVPPGSDRLVRGRQNIFSGGTTLSDKSSFSSGT